MNLCTKNMVAVNIVLMDKLSYKFWKNQVDIFL